ncbi:16S rRNA (cytosine(1402)-N(4))-methyltransferase RsmH [Portibacter lacus]|uniref:Ribosomal RNA small subunit methyltransferase H n=1 Tax=Portibacter lacus TaxID=1099794 RepID=A0AA37SML8_9BACT|nr:16S rRNA (cytosine(1402)-N(4))-methyltransferase RsmH [Portibacter lacus]GLR15774.1 ribosomal RNA small subunit methyltransferase H [Portibacter lacus]
MEYHNPVLLKESVDELVTDPDGVYVDVTFGGGGHSREILDRLSDKGRLIAFDQDVDAHKNSIDDDRIEMVHANFCFLERFLKLLKVDGVDGVLGDLGVSSFHLNAPERGFSFRYPEVKLDMRMNPLMEETAVDLIRDYSEEQLVAIFSAYGEIRNSKTLAQEIVTQREQRGIETVGDLLQVLEPVIRGSRNRYLAQVFQAIRIELNDEMGTLEEMLSQSLKVLKKGGRMVIISYHSLEDRMVKNFIKSGNAEGEIVKDDYGRHEKPFKSVIKKVMVPSGVEIRKNNRARSAKLRAAVKN